MDNVKISKFLSYVLRHCPEKANLVLDRAGWANTLSVLKSCNLTLSQLEDVVDTDNKQRYEFNDDKTLIRARQGHSVPVDLGYLSTEPPEMLFHGTVNKNLNSIKHHGLVRNKRHHVHLSVDVDTAKKVGQRYGQPIILKISAKKMHDDGFKFYKTDNNVWLTEHVPPKYIEE